MMLKAENLEPACPVEFNNLISILFVFYGLEEMLTDSQNLTRDQFKGKWKHTLGDEYTGKNSRARYKRMKEAHDDAKARLFTAAAAHGLLSRLDKHIMSSAEKAQYSRTSPEETARLREKIAELLKQEKEDRFFHSQLNPVQGWQVPQPMVMKTPDSSSSTGLPIQTYTSGNLTLKENEDEALTLETMVSPW